MKETFETETTEFPVCPFCGYEHTGAWDWEDDNVYTADCEECDKTFEYDKIVEVRYNTREVWVNPHLKN